MVGVMEEEIQKQIVELKEWVFRELIKIQKQIDELKEEIKEIKFETGNYYGE